MLSSDALIDLLADGARSPQRTLLAVAGPPGAGKSTIAQLILDRLVEREVGARIIPMDGFHYDNRILAERELLGRKGAPETFDAAGFVALVHRLRSDEGEICIPVFDRAADIAIAGADIVLPKHRVLVVEGNYLLLRDAPWTDLPRYWTHSIMLQPEMQVLEERLVRRWIDHGLDPAAARQRAMGNDISNAHTVLERSAPPSLELSPDAFASI